MAKKIDIEQLKAETLKPLYALAGATELAVDFARGYAADAQKVAQDRISTVQARVKGVELPDTKELPAKARTLVNAQVKDLQSQAKDAQTKFEARVKELQKETVEFPSKVEAQLTEALDELNSTYVDLAKRGEKFVAAIKKDGIQAVTSKKAPAQKAPAQKAPAAKKAPAKKAPAKKAPAKKAPAKKA